MHGLAAGRHRPMDAEKMPRNAAAPRKLCVKSSQISQFRPPVKRNAHTKNTTEPKHEGLYNMHLCVRTPAAQTRRT